MPLGNAFIGVSLGSRHFTREWILGAFEYILDRHDQLAVMLADEIWLYTRLADHNSDILFQLGFARARMERVSQQMAQLFNSCRARLPDQQRNRVKILRWSDYSDAQYAKLLQSFRLAAAYLPRFSASVEATADRHVGKLDLTGPAAFGARTASRDYVLDEMAMCLRMTEVAGFTAEYYPGEDLTTLRDLYADCFVGYGLTTEALIGRARRRVFNRLDIGNGTAGISRNQFRAG